MTDIQTIKDTITSFTSIHHEDIYNTIASKNGIQSWFAAYISSDAFAGLPPAEKAEALEMYEGVKSFLVEVERLADELIVEEHKGLDSTNASKLDKIKWYLGQR